MVTTADSTTRQLTAVFGKIIRTQEDFIAMF
jgi:hypothetical protein